MSARRTRIIAIMLLAALVLPLLAACGSPAKPAAQPTATSAAPASGGNSNEPGEPEPKPTTAPAQPSSGGDPQTRVTESLNLLNGTGDEGSVFPSYHIEVKTSGPSLSMQTKEVYISTLELQADVEGENVHLTYTDQDGEPVEGYIIGDDNYTVDDGELKEGGFGVAMTWAMWPLEPVIMLSLAALGASPAGSEAIDGRSAEVYDVDMAKGDPTVREMIQSMIGKGVKASHGKVWVDQETGGLLKTILDFEQDIYDLSSDDKDAPPVGGGSGHIEILVTQVGQVSVSLPE